MIVDTLLVHSRETSRFAAFVASRETGYVLEDRSFHGECWMDDLPETDYCPEDGTPDDDDWMDDDLDEAA